mmetsp:Transcript_13538/g.18732  ORF Transcript_13538/g.18732 Transcript_13538/m.18732 type:complete len:233 (+) Transcript_13538:1029-1727(+)
MPATGAGLHKELNALPVALDVGSKTALIADIGSVLAIPFLDHLLKGVVHLATDLHGLAESSSTSRQHHELLESELVASVRTTVDHVEGWHGKNQLGVTSQVCVVLVERHALGSSAGLRDSKRDTKDGIGAELGLVLRAIQIKHDLINLSLLSGVLADQSILNQSVDVVYSLKNALTHVPVATVTKLAGLVDTSGSAAGYGSAEHAIISENIDLHSGVATGIDDLAALDVSDG